MKIGILGAGQLARMMILNSKYLGVDFLLYCESVTPTTKGIAEHMVASYTDQKSLSAFCEQVDVVTFESENFEEETIDFILSKKPLYPPKKALLTAQDRFLEKTMACELDIPTNAFRKVDSYKDLVEASEEFSFPLIAKARRFGYDGKHQYHIKTQEQLKDLAKEDFSNFLAESYVPFSHEVSVIAVRSKIGSIRFYDLCHNDHKNGILHQTRNLKEDPLFEKAKSFMTRVLEHLNYVGVLTIEFFVKEGELLMNEMAPRVHNSGHWTIEGARVSQFENHIRAVAGLPLGSTDSLGSFKMQNAIGELPEREKSLEGGAYFHDYQKTPRPGRKLGHSTSFLTETP